MANLVTIPNFSEELKSFARSSDITKIIWHKKINDFVKNGDIICSIETEEALMEVESYHEGYILFFNGKTKVKYLEPLYVIGEKGESYSETIDDYEKNRNKQTNKQPSFTIENTFKPYGHEKIYLGDSPFIKWLKKVFK